MIFELERDETMGSLPSSKSGLIYKKNARHETLLAGEDVAVENWEGQVDLPRLERDVLDFKALVL